MTNNDHTIATAYRSQIRGSKKGIKRSISSIIVGVLLMFTAAVYTALVLFMFKQLPLHKSIAIDTVMHMAWVGGFTFAAICLAYMGLLLCNSRDIGRKYLIVYLPLNASLSIGYLLFKGQGFTHLIGITLITFCVIQLFLLLWLQITHLKQCKDKTTT